MNSLLRAFRAAAMPAASLVDEDDSSSSSSSPQQDEEEEEGQELEPEFTVFTFDTKEYAHLDSPVVFEELTHEYFVPTMHFHPLTRARLYQKCQTSASGIASSTGGFMRRANKFRLLVSLVNYLQHPGLQSSHLPFSTRMEIFKQAKEPRSSPNTYNSIHPAIVRTLTALRLGDTAVDPDTVIPDRLFCRKDRWLAERPDRLTVSLLLAMFGDFLDEVEAETPRSVAFPEQAAVHEALSFLRSQFPALSERAAERPPQYLSRLLPEMKANYGTDFHAMMEKLVMDPGALRALRSSLVFSENDLDVERTLDAISRDLHGVQDRLGYLSEPEDYLNAYCSFKYGLAYVAERFDARVSAKECEKPLASRRYLFGGKIDVVWRTRVGREVIVFDHKNSADTLEEIDECSSQVQYVHPLLRVVDCSGILLVVKGSSLLWKYAGQLQAYRYLKQGQGNAVSATVVLSVTHASRPGVTLFLMNVHKVILVDTETRLLDWFRSRLAQLHEENVHKQKQVSC